MSTQTPQFDSSSGSEQFHDYDDLDTTTEDTRHSREDAVEPKTFELLVESTYRMDEYYGLQCRFILMMAGRLGLRSGEIAHMDEEWIDWRRSMIVIPRHYGCEKGRDGGVCGQCKQSARQKARIRSEKRYADAHADLADDAVLEPGGGIAAEAVVPEEAFYDSAWSSKTDNAAREIPFDSVPRAGIVVDRFFDRWDAWPVSQTAINRRVDRMAEMTDAVDDDALYPHCLRSTCATYWADRSLNAHSLKGLMGWSQLSTARAYISDSGQRTAQAMRDASV